MTWVDDEVTAEEREESDADSEGERCEESPEEQRGQVVDHLRVRSRLHLGDLGCNLGSDLGYNLGALFVSLMIAMHCLIARQLKQSHNNTNTVMISVPMPQLT